MVGCGGAFAGSSSMSAARVFYTGQMTRQQCNNLPLISAGSNRLFFPLQDSCLGPSPAGGRVLQSPFHGRLIEGDRLSILNLNGCRLEGEGVGVGRSPRQRDQGRRRTLLQLSFMQRQNDASYNTSCMLTVRFESLTVLCKHTSLQVKRGLKAKRKTN